MGRPRSTTPRPPAAARGDEGPRKPHQFKLAPTDLVALDEVAAELARRDRSAPSRARAVRWAIRELAARLGLERRASRSPCTATFTRPGPFTEPPDP